MAELTWDEAARATQAVAHHREQRRRELDERHAAQLARLSEPGCICEPLLGTTCAMHAEQARAAAAGRPMVDEIAARAAGWVPLDKVIDHLRVQAALMHQSRVRVLAGDLLDEMANELTERFGQGSDGAGETEEGT